MTDTCLGKKDLFVVFIKMPNKLECPGSILLLAVTDWALWSFTKIKNVWGVDALKSNFFT